MLGERFESLQSPLRYYRISSVTGENDRSAVPAAPRARLNGTKFPALYTIVRLMISHFFFSRERAKREY